MSDGPIIGLGCQRSGTSVTAHILAAPEASGFHMENGIMRAATIWFGHALHDGAALSAARFAEFLKMLMIRGEAHGARLRGAASRAISSYQKDGRLQGWIDADDGIGFVRQLCYDVLTDGVEDVAYWGDKYPEHLFYADELSEVFPDARWIFVWREPASVIEALSRKIISSKDRPVADWRFSVEDCATQWVKWNRKWLQLRGDMPDGSYCEVSFDALVSDPSSELPRVSSFIGFDLLDDPAANRLAKSLRPGDLDKWRSSPVAGQVQTQLDRDDVRETHAALLALAGAGVT
jgi:hypothetical protein